MKSVFNVVVVVVVAMFISSCGMMATAGEGFVADEAEDKSANEIIDDEKVIDNEITDDATDEVIIDEESDSEISDKEITDEEIDSEINDNVVVDEEEVTDEVIEENGSPVVNIFKSYNGEVTNNSEVSVVVYLSEISESNLCVEYQVLGGTIGIDYGISTSNCSAGAAKIVAGTTAVEIKITNLNKTTVSKNLVVKVFKGEGYEIGNSSEVSIKLLEKEEIEVVDEEVTDNEVVDNEVSDEELDAEVVDDETTDDEIVDNEVSDDEVSDEVSDDETADEEVSDEDTSLPEIIIATEAGPSSHCHSFQTLLDPGTTLELWPASGARGLVLTNNLQVPTWYSHTGWCSATSDHPMDAKGTGWTAEDIQCIAHNGDKCL